MLRSGWGKDNEEFIFWNIQSEVPMKYLRGGVDSPIKDWGHKFRVELWVPPDCTRHLEIKLKWGLDNNFIVKVSKNKLIGLKDSGRWGYVLNILRDLCGIPDQN